MHVINLYSGYEGNSEIVLTEESPSGEILLKIQLLEFHFNEVLSFIPLGQYHEDSVMHNYFTVSGWHDDKWECKRIQEFYDQLIALDNIIPMEYVNACNAMKQVCNSSIDNGNKLFILLE